MDEELVANLLSHVALRAVLGEEAALRDSAQRIKDEADVIGPGHFHRLISQSMGAIERQFATLLSDARQWLPGLVSPQSFRERVDYRRRPRHQVRIDF